MILAGLSVLFVLAALALASLALTRFAGPQSRAAGLAGFLIVFLALTAAFTELVGRFAFTRNAFLAAAGALLLATGALWLWRGPAFRRPTFRFPRLTAVPFAVWPFAIIGLGLLFYGAFVQVVTPAGIGDALRYHFAAPANWAAMDRIAYAPGADFRINHFPHVMGLLWGLPIAPAGNDFVSGLFPLIAAFILWPSVIYFIARSLDSDPVPAFILSVTAASAPLVTLQGINHGVDVLFWAASLMAVFTALKTDSFRHNWLIFACAAGLALGTKSFGLVIVAGAAPLWFGRAAFLRFSGPSQEAKPGRITAFSGEILAAGVVILLIGGWVYGANLVAFGNPLYPYDFPIHFGNTPLDERFSSKGVLSSSASYWDSFRAIAVLTPQLLLGLPPLARDFTANSAGFGLTGAFFSALFAVSALVFYLKKGPKSPRTLVFFYVFCAIILGLNAILITRWGFQVAQDNVNNYSSVARYQLFWLAFLTIGAAIFITKRPVLRAPAYLILGLCLVYNAQIVTKGQSASLNHIERGLRWFPDRLQQGLRNEHLPTVAINNLTRFPDANVLLISSKEYTYSFYFPHFERRVFVTPINGPSKNILRARSEDRRIYDAILAHRKIPKNCVAMIRKLNPNAAISPRRAANYALIDQTIFENDIRFIFEYRSRPYLLRDNRMSIVTDRTDLRIPLVFYEVKPGTQPVWEDFADCLEAG